MAENYNKKTIVELKVELKERGLDTIGKKVELVTRLLENDKEATANEQIDENGHDEIGEEDEGAGFEVKDEDAAEVGEDDGVQIEDVVEREGNEDDAEKVEDDVMETEVKEEEERKRVVGGGMKIEVKPAADESDDVVELIVLDDTESTDEEKPDKSRKSGVESYEDMAKKLERMFKTNNRKARYLDNQMKTIHAYGFTPRHILNKELEDLLLKGRWYVFSNFKDERGVNSGMIEANFSTCDRAAEVAIALREYEETNSSGETCTPFIVKTEYGDFEEVLKRRDERRKEDKRKREEEDKRRKEREEERRIMAEREKEMAAFRASLDARSLYVGNLPPTATEEMVKSMFTEALRVQTQCNEDGTCKGHCYIEFLDEKVRDECVEKYKDAQIDDAGTTYKLTIKKMPLVSELPKEEEKPASAERKQIAVSNRGSKKSRSRSRSPNRGGRNRGGGGGGDRYNRGGNRPRSSGGGGGGSDFDRDRSRRFDRDRGSGRFDRGSRRSFPSSGRRDMGGDGGGGRGGGMYTPMQVGPGRMSMGMGLGGAGGAWSGSSLAMPSGMMASMLQMQQQLNMQQQQRHMQAGSLLGEGPIPSLTSLNMPPPGPGMPGSGRGYGEDTHRMGGRVSRFSH